MIGTSPEPLPEAGAELQSSTAPVVNLFAQSYRWWQLSATPGARQSSRVALSGFASDAIWQSSVAVVPCPDPSNASAGPCSCSLHAPATAVGRARSMSSLVVGGGVRILSVDHGEPQRPMAVVAVEGPLHIFSWCAGAHDGFSLEACARAPRWVIPGSRSVAVCRRHLRSLPRRLIDRREPIGRFVPAAAISLGQRYGVDVHVGLPAGAAAPYAATTPTPLASQPAQGVVADVAPIR